MLDLIAICCLGLYFAFPFVAVITLVVSLIYFMMKNSEVKLIKKY